MFQNIIILFSIFILVSIHLINADIYTYIYDSNPSVTCASLVTTVRNPFYAKEGTCLHSTTASVCNGHESCGYIMNCDSNNITMTVGYYYSAGTECLRGAPQATNVYPLDVCLGKDTGGIESNGYPFIIHCQK